MSPNIKPLLAITQGDPTGIGPEIIVSAWGDVRLHQAARLVAVGNPGVFQRAAAMVGSHIEVVALTDLESLPQGKSCRDYLPCLTAGDDSALAAPIGEHHAWGGKAAYDALALAVQAAKAKRIDGLVTAPLSKAALHMAGYTYPGHTEMLAAWCGVKNFAMMLYLPPGPPLLGKQGLGVAHVTLHTSLRKIWDELSERLIVERGELLHHMMRKLGCLAPRIAVAALNPHGGEQGLFGDEEQLIISPAVDCLRLRGVDASGPFPVDTLMIRAREGEFDGVVAMYHDQGHIALKLLGMDRAVNITLGLPIVRTSVAHGTAHDVAGKGVARHASLLEAVDVAAKLAT